MFKVGDRVKLVTALYGDSLNNPVWRGVCGEIVGTVKEISNKDLPIKVNWDNGEQNPYTKRDLELITKEDENIDKIVEKALEKSIEHWEKIVIGESYSTTDNCSLCNLFFINDCEGCPIKEKTGQAQCDDSPFREFIKHINLNHKSFIPVSNFHYQTYCPECKRLAREELEFLKSLRKEIYSIGDKFKDGFTRDVYILAQTLFGKVSLINLIDANRYREPEAVNDIHKITEEEMKRIAGDSFPTGWTKIND
jgi:hypothetical protein